MTNLKVTEEEINNAAWAEKEFKKSVNLFPDENIGCRFRSIVC